MKTFISIVILTLAMMSCQKENFPIGKISHAEAGKKLMPYEQYKNSKFITFFNSDQEEKILSIKYVENEITDENGFNYLEEKFTIFDPENPSYFIYVFPFIQKLNTGIIEGIEVSLITNLNNGDIATILLDEKGNTILIGPKKNYDLLGKTFNGVYKATTHLENSRCSELYYNFTKGVVAFKDEYNDLWVLKDIK